MVSRNDDGSHKNAALLLKCGMFSLQTALIKLHAQPAKGLEEVLFKNI